MNGPVQTTGDILDIERPQQDESTARGERRVRVPTGRSISCVIPCFNEAGNLNELLARLEEALWATHLAWEIIVVDDGSTDGTVAVAEGWCQLSGFRCISLSRNFGKEAALTAGLEAACGDAVVVLDGDLQHSPSLIADMLARWQGGADVVYTVRQERSDEHRLKRWGASLFYKLVNSSHRFELPRDAGDFRLMDRKVVDALLSLPERTRFMKGLYAWVGFNAVALPYTPGPRGQGESSFNAMRLFNLAVDGLTSFTTWPLRVVSVVGLMLAVPAFAYGIYLVVEHLLIGNAVSGWTTIVVSLMFFIGIQMISTGIVGEYVARIFEEVKGRPLYVVKKDLGHGLDGQQS
ncbi:glycosyltransferase family 2 protein [Variovorax sp. LjRoot84]|uniref:glycosyltransferase family 2 protein n=1 Tax=unclassified Variovorax TaxID=663243 RepID=UPI00088AC929|nr:glycosyltransferase family 2 protein [Variovorax sp. CF079]SDE59285.1 Glycosyltransferase involved in cell wall bisynthesis [Variovorax sp. CF079]